MTPGTTLHGPYPAACDCCSIPIQRRFIRGYIKGHPTRRLNACSACYALTGDINTFSIFALDPDAEDRVFVCTFTASADQ